MQGKFEIFDNELIKYEGTDSIIVVPNSITTIRDFAFYNCENLETITIPNSVTSIGSYAFYGCEKLKTIILPESLKFIGGGAFSCCKALETITIPQSIKTINKSTFYKCDNLKNIQLSPSLISIEHSAFGFCLSLKKIDFPSSLKTIGDSAFEECASLKAIVLPDSTTTIGKKTFFHCVHLRKITISDNLQNVGEGAFQTHGTLTFISNNHLFLTSAMFDCNWNLNWNYSFKMKNGENYKLVNSYLPNLDFKKWKPFAKIILLTNFLETYAMYQDEQREMYYQRCVEYKKDLLEFLIMEKRYIPLNQGLELGLFTSADLEPYFDKITDREQKAKILEYKNKSNENNSVFDDLENELLSIF